MKQLTALLVSCILLFTLIFPVCATSSSYTDDETANVLTLPSGWTVEKIANNIAIKAKFLPSRGSAIMTYGSFDLWSSLKASEKKKYSRDALNNDYFTKAQAAEYVGCTASQTKLTKIDGIEYFRCETTKKASSSLSLDLTYWIRVEDGWMYLYQFGGSDTSLLADFEDLIASATYGQTPPVSNGSGSSNSSPAPQSGLSQDIYDDAVRAYNSGRYSEAERLFNSVSAYSDSSKYLRLIQIRNMDRNTGIGCVYNYNKRLTDAEKLIIDAAAEDFYFADTAEVLLSNTEVAAYYLLGTWTTPTGVSPFSRLDFKKDRSWGYKYTRSENLSKKKSDCVSIINGEVRISITSSNTLVFDIELISPDCMNLYSYEYQKQVTLFRK